MVQEVVNDTKVIVNSNKLRDKMSKASKNGEIASHANNKRKLQKIELVKQTVSHLTALTKCATLKIA